MLKGSAKSKTMWFAVAKGVAGASVLYFPLAQDIITPETYGITMIGIGIVDGALRSVTTKALEDK